MSIIHALRTEREAPWCYILPLKTLIVMWLVKLNVVLFRLAVFFGQLSKTFTVEAESQYCYREMKTDRIRSIKVHKYSSTAWCRQTLKAILKKVSWFFCRLHSLLIYILYSGPTSGIRVVLTRYSWWPDEAQCHSMSFLQHHSQIKWQGKYGAFLNNQCTLAQTRQFIYWERC